MNPVAFSINELKDYKDFIMTYLGQSECEHDQHFFVQKYNCHALQCLKILPFLSKADVLVLSRISTSIGAIETPSPITDM